MTEKQAARIAIKALEIASKQIVAQANIARLVHANDPASAPPTAQEALKKWRAYQAAIVFYENKLHQRELPL